MGSRKERRTAVRHSRRMKIPCSVQHISEEGPWDAVVLVVSVPAIRFLSVQPFRVGMHVSLELPDEEGHCPQRLLRLTMVKPQKDRPELLMDGLFFKELSQREVDLLRARLTPPLARSVAPARPAMVGWKTACRLVRVRHEGPWLITMLDVSHSGIGMLMDRPLDAGTFLQIELPSIRRKHLKPRLVRVTHSKPMPGGEEWSVGGIFLRGLTEEELQALL
jgi:hypothetical protein